MLYSYIIFILIGILLESSVLAIPLGLIFFLLLLSSRLDNIRGMIVPLIALITGSLLDILLLRSFGLTSIFYLVSMILMYLYSRKFEIARLGYLIPYTFVVIGLYSWYFYKEWQGQLAIAIALLFLGTLMNKSAFKRR